MKSLKEKKLISLQDYLEEFNDIIKLENFKNITEKYLLSESAKGNVLFNVKHDYLVTDLTWFIDILNGFNRSKKLPKHLQEIYYALNDDVSIWSLNDLNEKKKK